jgi:thioredoxin-like negative regulator of GroEL
MPGEQYQASGYVRVTDDEINKLVTQFARVAGAQLALVFRNNAEQLLSAMQHTRPKQRGLTRRQFQTFFGISGNHNQR